MNTKIDEIIVVKQLPIIEEQLKNISAAVQDKVNKALALVCDEQSLPLVKDVRAELRKDFTDLEERRKAVKQKIAEPYIQFEEKYKQYISNEFKEADAILKERIDLVEEKKRLAKREVIEQHFNEMCMANGIDFVSFDDLGMLITLSASEKSLKEKVDEKIQVIANDLEVISAQENKDEILYEYRRSKNLAFAINTVAERKKALEPKKDAPQVAIKQPEDNAIYTVCLTLHGTRKQMNALKEFLTISGITWEGRK